MGNSSASANREKNSNVGSGRNIIFTCSSVQGWRVNMEDAHIFDAKLEHDISIFGVFDGHGGLQRSRYILIQGKEVALYVEKHFIPELKLNQNYKNKNFKEALHDTFLKMDEMIKS